MKNLYAFIDRNIVSCIRLAGLLLLLLPASGWSQGTPLVQGDLSIIGFNSYNTGEGLAFVIWKPIVSGTEIRFTDNGFNNPTASTAANNIRWQEQVIVWTATANMTAGTVITFANETPSAGTLAMYNSNGQSVTFWSLLNSNGDQIFAYQGVNMPTTPTPPATGSNTMTFANTILFGAGYQSGSANATWIAAGPATTNFSCLPSDLASGNNHIYLPGAAVNCGQYTGPRTGFANAADYRAAIANVNNWEKPSGTNVLVTYNTTTFELGAAPSITGHPANKTVCAGVGTTFTVTAANATSYKWEINTGSGFGTLSNGGVYSGATSATLTLSSATTASMNGYQYRCVATGTSSPAATSTAATLTVNALPSVTAHPSNTAICVGTGASFTAAIANTNSLIWQVNTGSGFQNITNNGTYSGQGTTTLTITGATTGMNNYTYRLTGTGICAPEAVSNAATLTVNAAPTISANPSNTTICAGSGTFFAITANNASAYQWQADTGSGFSNLANNATYAGVNNPTLNISNVTVAMNNYQYRCIASSPCNPSATSSTVTLGVLTLVTYYRDADNDGYGNPSLTQTSCAGAPSGYVANSTDCNDANPAINPNGISFSQNPSNSTVCQNSGTAFQAASNADSYQWQVNTGSGFNSLSNDGTYSGVTSATLTLTGVTPGMNGYAYRAVGIKSCTGNVNSGSAVLTVNVAPSVTVNLAAATVCAGGNASFSATVSNASSYVWQVNPGSGFSDITNGGVYAGQGTQTLTVTNAPAGMNNYSFRLVASGICAPAATAGPVVLTVNAAPSITAGPSGASICSGAAASFAITAANATAYQWQVNDGGNFSDVSNNGTYSGATTNTLAITGATQGMNGFLYRCVVSGSCAPAATSGNAALAVSPLITYYRDADNDGYGNPAVSQTSCNAAPAGYVNNNTDCNDNDAAQNPAPIVFTLQPVNTVACESSNTSFQVAANAGGYQWQADTGSGFFDVFDDGTHSGTNTNNLSIFFATSDLNGYIYRCIASKSCTADVISDAAVLTIAAPPAIVSNIAAATVCAGGNVTFTGVVNNASVYTWQVSTGGAFSAVPNNAVYSGLGTAALTINAAAISMNGYRYRLIVSGSCAPAAVLGPVLLTVSPNTVFYRDFDGDGFGNAAVSQASCTGSPAGYVADATDCNDNSAAVHPGAVEIYGNGIDDDCNGTIDTDALPCSATTTWNGSVWAPFPPVATQKAIIDGNYAVAADLSACTLTVASGTVTVPSGHAFIINGDITVATGATVTFSNNANLIQASPTAVNTGNITFTRNTSIRRLDYTYWSSPVSGQFLKTFSPWTVSMPVGASRFYTFDEPANSFIAIDSPETTQFTAAKGYNIRAPNNQATTPAPWTGLFTGTPHNGDIPIAVTVTGPDGFNLIGNPYPSTISASAFLQEAANTGTLYFWTHSVQNAASNANYATYNEFASVPAVAGGDAPNGTIQTGQGFVLLTTSPGNVIFKNSMRVNDTSGQFYRSAADDKSRIWLNLSSAAAPYNQMVIGYAAAATNAPDAGLDARLMGGETTLSSVIENRQYVIQARAAFMDTDVVPLHFTAEEGGSYTITIDHFDGLFASPDTGGQDIFLKDDLLGITHNIKVAPYHFVSAAGSFADRFSVVYQNTALGTAIPAFRPGKVVLFKENNAVTINSGTAIMDNVKVFDLRGRLIYEQKGINASSVVLSGLDAAGQVFLFQVTSDKNEVVTKKGVF